MTKIEQTIFPQYFPDGKTQPGHGCAGCLPEKEKRVLVGWATGLVW
jgi:hypothetical protein